MDEKFVRQMQLKVAIELNNKEKEILAYWLSETKKILAKHYQDLARQSLAIQELVGRMETRLKTIK